MAADDDALPETVGRRLHGGAFSSGLSAPDLAACLAMGLEPVALVQGFCAMKWSWYGAGSSYFQPWAGAPVRSGSGLSPSGSFPSGSSGGGFVGGAFSGGGFVETYRCPHGFVSSDHRAWGQNFEQSWIESAWAQGFGAAYERLLEEATSAGAHGVIGIVDTTRSLADLAVTEFHMLGTAVVVADGAPPPGRRPWSTYLAGQRLAKLIESGLMPVEVTAAFSSVRVWAYCMTDYLMEGRNPSWGAPGTQDVEQVTRARMAVRQLARARIRDQLGTDSLHGARMTTHHSELGEGDEVIECTLRGTRVRRFKGFDALPPPGPTVRLS